MLERILTNTSLDEERYLPSPSNSRVVKYLPESNPILIENLPSSLVVLVYFIELMKILTILPFKILLLESVSTPLSLVPS